MRGAERIPPIIRRLEADYPGRSAIPPDPALHFLDYLIEDYADEWLTKPMFHIRWYYDADADMAAPFCPTGARFPRRTGRCCQTKSIPWRQESRLYVVEQ